MDFLEIGLFFAVSFVAAAVNSVAGGGTFLTFPVFMLNGLSPLQANIMSTIALWPGAIASAHGYRGVAVADRRFLVPFLWIGVIGSACGALLLLATPEAVFTRMVPWLLLIATLIFTFGRRLISHLQRWVPAGAAKSSSLLLQIVIAVYGGYFGAGIGILTLAMLQLLGFHHIHQMNSLKSWLVSVIHAVGVVVFIASGNVVWDAGVVMITGAILGGYIGARLALRVSPHYVRMLVSAIGFAMTAYFFAQ